MRSSSKTTQKIPLLKLVLSKRLAHLCFCVIALLLSRTSFKYLAQQPVGSSRESAAPALIDEWLPNEARRPLSPPSCLIPSPSYSYPISSFSFSASFLSSSLSSSTCLSLSLNFTSSLHLLHQYLQFSHFSHDSRCGIRSSYLIQGICFLMSFAYRFLRPTSCALERSNLGRLSSQSLWRAS